MDDKDKRIEELERQVSVLEIDKAHLHKVCVERYDDIRKLEKENSELSDNLVYFENLAALRRGEAVKLESGKDQLLEVLESWRERALKAEADFAALTEERDRFRKWCYDYVVRINDIEKENRELNERLDAIKAVLGKGVI